jgi:PAS domain S-box-containing protein
MVEAALQPLDTRGVVYRLSDETAPVGERLLFTNHSPLGEAEDPSEDGYREDGKPRLHSGATFAFAGRRWSIRFAPTAEYLADQRFWEARTVLAGGLLFSSLLGVFLLSATGRTATIERVVLERTAELEAANASLENEIAAHQRTEEALTESEARTRAIVETAAEGVITIDERAVVQAFNAAAERLFGYQAAEVIGHNVNMLQPEPYHSHHDSYIQSYLRTGVAKIIGISREVEGRRKDGTVFPLHLAVSEVRLGERRLFTGIVADISERKQAEQKLERLAAELARSNADLEEFAYVASHDLRAPLRAISNLSEWIEEDLGESLAGDIQKNTDLLRSRVQRMERLIDDLLTYSRAGRVAAEIKTVDAAAMLTDVIFMLDPPEGFTIEIGPNMPVFETAEAPLQQVFHNLVGNALKHHDRKDGRIDLASSTVGDLYEFSVTDDGPGIAPEFQESVFQMFQTLQSRDKVEGSGMGLALVKKIIEHHGGRIELESAPGQGTTFRFTWPKHIEPEASDD